MMAKRYKVTKKGSSYYGQIGELLDKDGVREVVGNAAGRSPSWYEGWDLLLTFEGERDVAGVGFKWSEVEYVLPPSTTPRKKFDGDAFRRELRLLPDDAARLRRIRNFDRNSGWGYKLEDNPYFAPGFDAGGGYEISGGVEGGWHVRTPEGLLTVVYGHREDAVAACDRLARGRDR